MYGFMQPALDWIQQWLPLFYLPPLVNLPYELQGLSTTDLLGLLLIVLLGWGLNLWVSVRCSTWVRSITKTNLQVRTSPLSLGFKHTLDPALMHPLHMPKVSILMRNTEIVSLLCG